MRVVLDTNCVISGLFWQGPPRALLELARAQRIRIYTSTPLTSELAAVLDHPKFSPRLRLFNVTADHLVAGYSSLAYLIKRPQAIQPVCRDPSDDEVIACARAAQADLIASGDKDLLVLKHYGNCVIATASQALSIIRSTIGP